MSFIKHGDGKIVSVVNTEELTEEQKKAAKDICVNKLDQQTKETDEVIKQDAGRN